MNVIFFFPFFFFNHDYSVRKSFVCAYVCVNILSHISRVAQPGLLYVLSLTAIGARAPFLASLRIIPLELGISPSWAPSFSLSHILSTRTGISNNHFARWVDAL